MSADDGNLARVALRKIDEALMARPSKDGHALSAALTNLCGFRDALRSTTPPTPPATFDTLNATISVVMGAQYPLGEVPWRELEAARGWLADVLARTPG